jgi:hypothetical protein
MWAKHPSLSAALENAIFEAFDDTTPAVLAANARERTRLMLISLHSGTERRGDLRTVQNLFFASHNCELRGARQKGKAPPGGQRGFGSLAVKRGRALAKFKPTSKQSVNRSENLFDVSAGLHPPSQNEVGEALAIRQSLLTRPKKTIGIMPPGLAQQASCGHRTCGSSRSRPQCQG